GIVQPGAQAIPSQQPLDRRSRHIKVTYRPGDFVCFETGHGGVAGLDWLLAEHGSLAASRGPALIPYEIEMIGTIGLAEQEIQRLQPHLPESLISGSLVGKEHRVRHLCVAVSQFIPEPAPIRRVYEKPCQLASQVCQPPPYGRGAAIPLQEPVESADRIRHGAR